MYPIAPHSDIPTYHNFDLQVLLFGSSSAPDFYKYHRIGVMTYERATRVLTSITF